MNDEFIDLTSALKFEISRRYDGFFSVNIYNTFLNNEVGYLYLEIIPIKTFQKIDYLEELNIEPENTEIIWISKIYIFEQNRGIGTFTLKNLNKILKEYILPENNYIHILEVDKYSEKSEEYLKNFYKKIGFKEIESKKNYMIKKQIKDRRKTKNV